MVNTKLSLKIFYGPNSPNEAKPFAQGPARALAYWFLTQIYGGGGSTASSTIAIAIKFSSLFAESLGGARRTCHFLQTL